MLNDLGIVILSPGHRHCNATLGDLVDNMAAVMNGQYKLNGYISQRSSHPRLVDPDRAGWWGIASTLSSTQFKAKIVSFWNFPWNIFWTQLIVEN